MIKRHSPTGAAAKQRGWKNKRWKEYRLKNGPARPKVTLFCDSEFAMGELFSYITSQTSKRRWLTLTSLVEEKLHPRVESKVERDSLLRRFEKFKEAAFRDGIIGTDRHKHYGTVYGKLYRFLI